MLGFPGSARTKRVCLLAAKVSSFLAHPPMGNTGPERAREQAAGTHGALTAVKAGGKACPKFNYFRDDSRK